MAAIVTERGLLRIPLFSGQAEYEWPSHIPWLVHSVRVEVPLPSRRIVFPMEALSKAEWDRIPIVLTSSYPTKICYFDTLSVTGNVRYGGTFRVWPTPVSNDCELLVDCEFRTDHNIKPLGVLLSPLQREEIARWQAQKNILSARLTWIRNGKQSPTFPWVKC